MSKNWQDHTWNKGGIRGNYGAYRDSIWNDLSAADTDGDGILSRGEFNKISNKHYDIIGDGRAPHTGNYFDEGGGIQEALARLATRNNISLDSTIMNQYGLRQDQATGDILSSAGFDHSAFGRAADDTLAAWEGYGAHGDWGDSHYAYDQFSKDQIPTWRYKWSNTDAWEPPDTTPKTPAPPYETPDDLIKDKEEWEAATQPKGPKVGDFGWDQDLLPITTEGLFGSKPGRRLGVDTTQNERYGSIPFVTSGQYYANLDRPNTRFGSKFGGGGDNSVGLHSSVGDGDSFGAFLAQDDGKFKGGKTLATKLLDEMSIG